MFNHTRTFKTYVRTIPNTHIDTIAQRPYEQISTYIIFRKKKTTKLMHAGGLIH